MKTKRSAHSACDDYPGPRKLASDSHQQQSANSVITVARPPPPLVDLLFCFGGQWIGWVKREWPVSSVVGGCSSWHEWLAPLALGRSSDNGGAQQLKWSGVGVGEDGWCGVLKMSEGWGGREPIPGTSNRHDRSIMAPLVVEKLRGWPWALASGGRNGAPAGRLPSLPLKAVMRCAWESPEPLITAQAHEAGERCCRKTPEVLHVPQDKVTGIRGESRAGITKRASRV